MRSVPHACSGCGSAFEVSYNHVPEVEAMVSVEIACPECGKKKSVPIPRGAESAVRVELDSSAETEEGGGD
jgi:DNA-directed RNA polymerase subunit RPC12/RpoP